MQCKCPDGVIREATWKFINKAWVPAITVCEQVLFTYPPVADGDAMTLGTTFPVVSEISEGIFTVDITPNANRTLCQFENPLTNDVTLGVDISNSVVGDELIIIFRVDTEVTIHSPGDKFFFQGVDQDLVINASSKGTDRWVMIFTFDGEKFVSTYENC